MEGILEKMRRKISYATNAGFSLQSFATKREDQWGDWHWKSGQDFNIF
jgi:hypothetical protein